MVAKSGTGRYPITIILQMTSWCEDKTKGRRCVADYSRPKGRVHTPRPQCAARTSDITSGIHSIANAVQTAHPSDAISLTPCDPSTRSSSLVNKGQADMRLTESHRSSGLQVQQEPKTPKRKRHHILHIDRQVSAHTHNHKSYTRQTPCKQTLVEMKRIEIWYLWLN